MGGGLLDEERSVHYSQVMAILVGVGSAQGESTLDTTRKAYQQAVESLNGHSPSIVMVLASSTTYDQKEMLREIKQLSNQANVIGCSTSGEITSAGPADKSMAVMAIYSDQMQFVSGMGPGIRADSREAGRKLAENIFEKSQGQKPRAGLIFPDGLGGNGADTVRGVLDVFGSDFMLAGGSAGDDFAFQQTYQYIENQVVSDTVVGVGLYGQFSFGIGVKHGWVPIGTPRKVTKSAANILYELDEKPAIEIYDDQFGKDRPLISKDEPFAKLAITYPLGIMMPGRDEYLIRDPLTVDDAGAITCAAEVPEGSEVHIMIGSREEAVEAAKEAAKMAMVGLNGKKPKGAFLFNCIARKKLLMNKKGLEIDTIRQVIGQDVPLIGFYTYGEQAPLGSEIITCSFHNETDVLFLLGE